MLVGDAAIQLAKQTSRSHSPVRSLDDDRHLPPIDLDVEIDPEPPAVTHIWRPEESLWICFHQHLLRSLWCSTPDPEAVVVMVVGSVGELLAGYEPGGLSVAELFGRLRQAETELSKLFDLGWVARPVEHYRLSYRR
jgi:hypothetical protein